MKRFFALLLATILLLSTMSFASAAGNKTASWNKYVLDDISVQLSIPSGYVVLTRGMDADDPTLKSLRRTPSDVDNELCQNSAYLFAYRYLADTTVIVSALEYDEVASIKDFSGDQLEFFRTFWSQFWTTMGAQIKESEILSVNGQTFVRHSFAQTNQGNSDFHYLYMTIQNSMLYSFDFSAPAEQKLKQTEDEFISEIKFITPVASESQTQPVSETNKGWNRYVIDELSMQISIPQDFYVLTRGMDPNSALLKVLGETPSSIDKRLSSQFIYLLATTLNPKEPSIMVGGGQYNVHSVRDYDEEALQLFVKAFHSFWESSGIEVKESKLIYVNGLPFARYFCTETQPGLPKYQLIYNTIQNDNYYAINYHFPSEQMIEEIEDEFLAGIKIFEKP